METTLILPSPPPTADIEDLADFEPARTCDPTARPGTKLLRRFVMDRVSSVQDGGIVRGCSAGDPTKVDEHKEGRAWDCSCPLDVGRDIVEWFLAPDELGRDFANARRLGVMYLIHDRWMWRAYPWAGNAAGVWVPYGGASPHADHVHISLGWAGAKAMTSFYAWIEAGAPGPTGEPPVGVPDSTAGKICAVVAVLGLAGAMAWQAYA